jgi:hypothetical protein
MGRKEMGNDKGFILGVMERWNLIAATLLIAYAFFWASSYQYDFIGGLTPALLLLIVGAGVVLKRKIAILVYKILLWGFLVILPCGVINPFLIMDSRVEHFSLTRVYCFSALAFAACSALLMLIAWGQKREKRDGR